MIISECGINWKGDIELAKRMILESKVCGADLAKFQLYNTESIHKPGSKFYDISKLNELSLEDADELFNYGKSVGIEVFFSIADIERVDWCEKIGVQRYKVAFSNRNNIELINYIWGTNKPVIISSDRPLLFECLYCVPIYPAPLSNLNFNKISFDDFDGFSDHTVGLDAAKIALSRGAKIIEKHFCLSRNGQGDNPDIPGSMLPEELLELVRFSNIVERSL